MTNPDYSNNSGQDMLDELDAFMTEPRVTQGIMKIHECVTELVVPLSALQYIESIRRKFYNHANQAKP